MLFDLLVFGAICFVGGVAAKRLGGGMVQPFLALVVLAGAVVVGEPDSAGAMLLLLASGYISLNFGLSVEARTE